MHQYMPNIDDVSPEYFGCFLSHTAEAKAYRAGMIDGMVCRYDVAYLCINTGSMKTTEAYNIGFKAGFAWFTPFLGHTANPAFPYCAWYILQPVQRGL